jgi:capsular polysaccharide transport system permease protein
MFPIWERAWAILNRPLVIVSCVLFTLDNVPQPFQDYLWWNPLVQIVGQVRSGIYPTYDASYVSPLYVFGVSGALLAAGLLLLDRYKSYLINDG